MTESADTPFPANKTYIELVKDRREAYLRRYKQDVERRAQLESPKLQTTGQSSTSRGSAEEVPATLLVTPKRSKQEIEASLHRKRLESFARLKLLYEKQGSSLSRDTLALEIKKMRVAQHTPADIDFIHQHLGAFLAWPNLDDYFGFRNSIAIARAAATEAEMLSVLQSVVEKHAITLSSKRRRMVYKNDYGVEKGRDNWEKEIMDFVRDVCPECLDQIQSPTSPKIVSIVDLHLSRLTSNIPVPTEIKNMLGVDFEIHCARILEEAGWSVVRNGRTGDQGVDLIACRLGLRVAIQCKRYSGTVGNKAVQEVFAGMKYEDCDRAVVVSNAAFTAGAVNLARTTGVVLLDDQSLSEMDHWLDISR